MKKFSNWPAHGAGLALLLTTHFAIASGNLPATVTPNDIYDERPGSYAITAGTIHIDHETVLSPGTLLVQDGVVMRSGSRLKIPAGYVQYEFNDQVIYPSFIELDSQYGLPPADPALPMSWSAPEVVQSTNTGAYNANEAIKAAYRAARDFAVNPTEAKKLRALGFGAALTHRHDGLARGTGALVLLGDGLAAKNLLVEDAAAHYAFDKGSSRQSYPISDMGFVAVLRQTALDADWYRRTGRKTFTDQSLAAWIANGELPQVIDASENWRALLRADRLADEFKRQFIIRAAGDEYQRINAVKATGASLIVPLDFPLAMDVSDPYESDRINLSTMKHWELAPYNLARLSAAGIDFAITSSGKLVEDRFLKNLRQSVSKGLDKSAALHALTGRPAQMLGEQKKLGHLRKGAIANFLVVSDDLFESESVIEQNWIDGKPYIINPHQPDLSGRYELTMAGTTREFEVTRKGAVFELQLQSEGDEKTPTQFSYSDGVILIGFTDAADRLVRLHGENVNGQWRGRGQIDAGEWAEWRARRVADVDSEAADDEDASIPPGAVTFPFVAYGESKPPTQADVLFRNATVWTNEADGILSDTDVMVKNGRISKVGRNLSAGRARVIDASGKHLTSGIIDEHSHIALSSVNDIATNSAMVRMADAIESEDVRIYRNLAGGVTAAQLLHGSANPIGGQSALVKMRWGATPEDMLIEDADGFIKFALGENVKRSRNPSSIRYPQTRMGVEQFFDDTFTRAADYQKNKSRLRPDLALDAVAEILSGDRFITCHSYVQSEINMLMQVADKHDFKVNTFTHILEGYKVADKMAAHGAGGSTFSDWWAYKWEVRYAIPYNAALMTQAGVNVAINSDDSEMSRRLNQEAAKTVKYGGVPEEEAWKMVTLNPAKMLHLDDRMGSVKTGKDADLVLWDDHPLSIYSRVEMTMVDGRILYSKAQDERLRQSINTERQRLLRKLQKANAAGEKQEPYSPPTPEWHCDSFHGYEHIAGEAQ